MDIYKKIEEIRKKPADVRMRYVWISVIVCMALVIVIWVFSFWSLIGKDEIDLNEKVEVFDSLKERTRTLEEYKGQMEEQIEEVKSEYEQLQEEMGGQENFPQQTGE